MERSRIQDNFQPVKMASESNSSLLLKSKYVPASYSVSLSIDHLKPNYSGSVLIPVSENPLFTGDSDGSFSMVLHAHRLIITEAELTLENSEKCPLKIVSDRTNQTVSLFSDSTETPKAIEITYLGSIATIRTYSDETYGVFKTNYSDSVEGKSDNYIIATHAQPFGCRRILPIIDELVHKVPISLTIQTKSLFKVVSNASLESSTIVDMTQNSLFVFAATPPIQPAHFGFAIGDFEVIENNSGRIPVRVLTTKGDASKALYTLDVTASLLPVFEDLLGPYPLTKFDIVALPFLSDIAMENWGMVTLIRENVLINLASASEEMKTRIRQLIAHQLTHQWFANCVSLDDWKSLWFVEAFATFVGNYALYVKSLEASDSSEYFHLKLLAMQSFMDYDCFVDLPEPSLQEYMNKLDLSPTSKTSSIFEEKAYEKGMILLNMIATLFQLENKSADFTHFFKAFRDVIDQYKFKTIKIFDIWNVLNKSTSYELLSFAHSWFRYPGFPLLEVSIKNNKLYVEQNRFFYDNDAKKLDLENAPFHVPLALKVLTDTNTVETVNLMLSDRSMELDMPASRLLCFNAGNQFYYRTVYSLELIDVIMNNVENNCLTGDNLLGVIVDYGKLIGQHSFHDNQDFFGCNQINFFIKLMNVFVAESWKLDYKVLYDALLILEVINLVFVHFTEYSKFQKWHGDVYLALYRKIGGWEEVLQLSHDNYSATEYKVRNFVLQGASEHKEPQTTCKKLYKNMISSGVSKKFTPKELFPLIFIVAAATANLTEYKQIMSIAKNSDVSFLKHSNGKIHDLQSAAVSSLGYCKKPELIAKTLHFVNNNIDSKGIELALQGFRFNPSIQAKEQLWAWYTVNYDQWVKRSLRKGSDWSKQIGETTKLISSLVLGEVMQYRKADAEKFVTSKEQSLPPHKIRENFDILSEEITGKIAIAALYEDLCI